MSPTALTARLATLGRALGEREAEHGEGLERARKCVEELRGEVAAALEAFHRAAAAAGAPHLRVELSPVRIDDKHLRSVEFELWRGRYRAIVTAKSRGDITFVGPFHVRQDRGALQELPDRRPGRGLGRAGELPRELPRRSRHPLSARPRRTPRERQLRRASNRSISSSTSSAAARSRPSDGGSAPSTRRSASTPARWRPVPYEGPRGIGALLAQDRRERAGWEPVLEAGQPIALAQGRREHHARAGRAARALGRAAAHDPRDLRRVPRATSR